ERLRPPAATKRDSGASSRQSERNRADRDPHHPAGPAIGAQTRNEIAARHDRRIEEVDDGRRIIEVRRAPGDRVGAAANVADGNRETRPSETQMPASEQTP